MKPGKKQRHSPHLNVTFDLLDHLRVASLLNLGLGGVGVGHLLVLGGFCLSPRGLGSLASLLLGGALSGAVGLKLGLQGLALGLDLVEVTLDDGAGQGADLVNLGDIDGLGGVITLVIEPVLFVLLATG